MGARDARERAASDVAEGILGGDFMRRCRARAERAARECAVELDVDTVDA